MCGGGGTPPPPTPCMHPHTHTWGKGVGGMANEKLIWIKQRDKTLRRLWEHYRGCRGATPASLLPSTPATYHLPQDHISAVRHRVSREIAPHFNSPRISAVSRITKSWRTQPRIRFQPDSDPHTERLPLGVAGGRGFSEWVPTRRHSAFSRHACISFLHGRRAGRETFYWRHFDSHYPPLSWQLKSVHHTQTYEALTSAIHQRHCGSDKLWPFPSGTSGLYLIPLWTLHTS